MIVERCPWCGGDALAPAHRRSDGRAVVRCAGCSLLFLHDRPDDLAVFYDGSYFDKAAPAGGEPEVGYAAYGACQAVDFRWQLALLKLLAPAPATVLELGSATGGFLQLARDAGYRARGIELVGEAAARAQAAGLDVAHASFDQFPVGETFDVVCAWEFVEHVADLRATLEKVRALVRPGGLFLFSTPDCGAEVVARRGDEWIGFRTSLEHVTYLTRPFLEKALAPLFGGPPLLVGFEHAGDCATLLGAARVGGAGDRERAAAALLDAGAANGVPAPTADAVEDAAWVLLQFMQWPRLDPLVERIARERPSSALLLRAGERFLRGRLDEAAPLLDEAARAQPGSPLPWQWSARNWRAIAEAHARNRRAEGDKLHAEIDRLTHEVARLQAELIRPRSLRERAAGVSWHVGHWMMRHVVAKTPFAQQGWRVFDVVQKEGVGGVARRVARPVRGRLQRHRTIAKLEEIARSPKLPVVLAPTVDWDITLFQRPQQMARAIGALGTPCLYVTTNQNAGTGGVREILPNVYLVDDLDLTLEVLHRFAFVVFSTCPERLGVDRIRAVAGKAVVLYDFIDEQHPDVYVVSDAMRARHDWLLAEADLVSVTADRLEEQILPVRRAPYVMCPNAADVDHFRVPAKPPAPDEMAPIAARGPIIGYYGALAKWFDYGLLRRVAMDRPDYQIVLIGVDYDRSLEKAGIHRLPNVHLLGPRPYEKLARYAAWFDVATIPFLINEVTESTSPIKLFEYMAARKPIVTTNLRECRKYKSVLIGESHAHFVTQLDRALSLQRDKDYLATLDREADDNSWRHRATQWATEVERLAAARKL